MWPSTPDLPSGATRQSLSLAIVSSLLGALALSRWRILRHGVGCFFFNDTATTEIYTLSLHDALPISTKPAMPFDSISAVLPAYNEEENIETATKRLADVLRSLNLRDWEVIVVDDGSVDQTGQIADRLVEEDPEHIRVFHHNPNRGYAEALKTGFTNARHQLIFYTDSDNQFDVREITSLLPLIENADIVNGFRIYRFDPLTRLVLSWGFNLLVRIMFRIKVRDIDCAFKLFRREVFDKVTIEDLAT